MEQDAQKYAICEHDIEESVAETMGPDNLEMFTSRDTTSLAGFLQSHRGTINSQITGGREKLYSEKKSNLTSDSGVKTDIKL